MLACHFTDTGVQRAWECLPVTVQHAAEGSGSKQKLPRTLFQDEAVPIGVSQMSHSLLVGMEESHSVEDSCWMQTLVNSLPLVYLEGGKLNSLQWIRTTCLPRVKKI